MLPFAQGFPGARPVIPLTSVDYEAVVRKGTTGANITAMADIVAGDLLLHNDISVHGSTIPGSVTPSGFTLISTRGNSLASGGWRQVWSYKVATGSEGSTDINGINGGPAGLYKTLIRLRPNRPFKSIADAQQFHYSGTTGNPASGTTNITGMTTPVFVLATYYKYDGSFSSATFSPTQNETTSNDFGSGYGGQQVRYLFSQTPHSDVTVDIGDTGNYTGIHGIYIRVT